MSATCQAPGCLRQPAFHQLFCRTCLQAMLDIALLPSGEPATWRYEHMATCDLCSKVTYNLMLTRKLAHSLTVVGVRCGFCRQGLMQIEELAGGPVRKSA